MPIYTYRCESCGVQFEKNQKFSDAPLAWCPECGKKSLRKVYTPVGIVFKGSGFYATDHRSPSGNRASNAHSSEEKSGAESTPAESKGSPAKGENAAGSTPSSSTTSSGS